MGILDGARPNPLFDKELVSVAGRALVFLPLYVPFYFCAYVLSCEVVRRSEDVDNSFRIVSWRGRC